jgi:site-specific recombinase XerD
MLRAPDLLNLKVSDVRTRVGKMRDTISLSRRPDDRRKRAVRCTLSAPTGEALERHISLSNKIQKDFLFCNGRTGSTTPLSSRQLPRIVKKLANSIGLDETEYGVESLRRTRAVHILRRSGDLESLTVLLGLSDVVKTAKYLVDLKAPVDALSVSRKYEII